MLTRGIRTIIVLADSLPIRIVLLEVLAGLQGRDRKTLQEATDPGGCFPLEGLQMDMEQSVLLVWMMDRDGLPEGPAFEMADLMARRGSTPGPCLAGA